MTKRPVKAPPLKAAPAGKADQPFIWRLSLLKKIGVAANGRRKSSNPADPDNSDDLRILVQYPTREKKPTTDYLETLLLWAELTTPDFCVITLSRRLRLLLSKMPGTIAPNFVMNTFRNTLFYDGHRRYCH